MTRALEPGRVQSAQTNLDASQIVGLFKRLVPLTDAEARTVAALANKPRRIAAGEVIRNAWAKADRLHVLLDGWAYCQRELEDGSRQILEIYMPGQIMGLREIGYQQSRSSFIAIGDVRSCSFSKRQFLEMIESQERLTSLFFMMAAREEHILVERLVNIGCKTAEQRLANFLLEIQHRIDPDNPEFELPMSQELIGDVLGMTHVHTCRMFGRLKKKQLIAVVDDQITIKKPAELMELAGFDPAYLAPDISWIHPGVSIPVDL